MKLLHLSAHRGRLVIRKVDRAQYVWCRIVVVNRGVLLVLIDRLSQALARGGAPGSWLRKRRLGKRLDFLGLAILLVVYMLLDGVVTLKELDNEFAVLFAFDFEAVSLLFNLDYSLSLGVQSLLHLLDGALNLGFLFLPLLELPLHSVDEILLRADCLKFLVPLHAILLECLNSLTVIVQNLGQMDALVTVLGGRELRELRRVVLCGHVCCWWQGLGRCGSLLLGRYCGRFHN